MVFPRAIMALNYNSQHYCPEHSLGTRLGAETPHTLSLSSSDSWMIQVVPFLILQIRTLSPKEFAQSHRTPPCSDSTQVLSQQLCQAWASSGGGEGQLRVWTMPVSEPGEQGTEASWWAVLSCCKADLISRDRRKNWKDKEKARNGWKIPRTNQQKGLQSPRQPAVTVREAFWKQTQPLLLCDPK